MKRPGLTPEQVLDIRQRVKEGVSQARLAREHRVSSYTIYKAVNYLSHNKVAIVESGPRSMARADEIEASALRMAAEQALLNQNAQISLYSCESCGVVEGGEHLDSCQDASGGTLVYRI